MAPIFRLFRPENAIVHGRDEDAATDIASKVRPQMGGDASSESDAEPVRELVDAMQARDSVAQRNALGRVCELIEPDKGEEHRVALYSVLKLARNMRILVEMLNSADGELRGMTFKLLWFATRYDPFRTLLSKDLFVGPICRVLKHGNAPDSLASAQARAQVVLCVATQ